jgi:hypothetical protein
MLQHTFLDVSRLSSFDEMEWKALYDSALRQHGDIAVRTFCVAVH